jgi:hypothetical protein
MSASATIRVVASPSDALAQSLCERARDAGWTAEHVSHDRAALETTVEVGDHGVRVRPETALYLRPPLGAPPDDPDERFLFDERLALLWAAATLTSQPVLSRPSSYGLWGRVTASARVTEHRAGQMRSRTEVFCTDAAGRDWPGTWAAESSDGIQGVWPRRGAGPFRARPIIDGERYESVTVVGLQAWRRSVESLDHLELERQSIAIASALELDFAVVWWAIPPEARSASLVRAVPAPSLGDVGPDWPDVAVALLALLSSA